MTDPFASTAPSNVYQVTLPARDWWDRVLIATIFSAILWLSYVALTTPLFDPIWAAARAGDWWRIARSPTALWVVMGLLLLLARTALWLRYREFQAASMQDAPSLTVIIPAYNEGAMVQQSIESVVSAHYPRDRIEIIVVDDGSTDDTWTYISRAASRHTGVVRTVRFPQNRGKRAALAEGIRCARGELVVTIDSDSVIERGTLLAISGPFRNPKVGAVAGKVAVYNRRAGLLPRMLHVRFILAFDLLRSVQSTFGTVYCCPGALAAYRTSVVQTVLEAWENQTFLGVRCTFGEDRAMTNLILAAGYDTVYQRSAVVHTVAPETYRKLCKMYLRWDRSYIREELRFCRILWTRPPLKLVAALFETTITNLRFPVAYTAIGLLILRSLEQPEVLLRMLVGIGIAGTFYMLYYLRSERSWDFLYGVLYAYFAFFALTWIFPFALLTVRARGWLTR